jgi:hypothetical protein
VTRYEVGAPAKLRHDSLHVTRNSYSRRSTPLRSTLTVPSHEVAAFLSVLREIVDRLSAIARLRVERVVYGWIRRIPSTPHEKAITVMYKRIFRLEPHN